MKISGIDISHPDKIIFPGQNITKADMIKYYDKIADRMLPHLKHRPLTLRRFPDGIVEDGFFQKHAQKYYPDFIERIMVETEKGKAEEIMCNNKKSLIYLADQGAVGFHIWPARQNDLHRPDKVVFDLDPAGTAGFGKVKEAASAVVDMLEEEGIDARPMTTGKSGMHIFYKIRVSKGFDEIRSAARETAQKLVEALPELFTLEMRINKRRDKIFLDCLRNAYGQTSICPFSLRPNEKRGSGHSDRMGRTRQARIGRPLQLRKYL